jgi:hypothetical protein
MAPWWIELDLELEESFVGEIKYREGNSISVVTGGKDKTGRSFSSPGDDSLRVVYQSKPWFGYPSGGVEDSDCSLIRLKCIHNF